MARLIPCSAYHVPHLLVQGNWPTSAKASVCRPAESRFLWTTMHESTFGRKIVAPVNAWRGQRAPPGRSATRPPRHWLFPSSSDDNHETRHRHANRKVHKLHRVRALFASCCLPLGHDIGGLPGSGHGLHERYLQRMCVGLPVPDSAWQQLLVPRSLVGGSLLPSSSWSDSRSSSRAVLFVVKRKVASRVSSSLVSFVSIVSLDGQL